MAYRVAFARGALALMLGVAMIVQPEKTSDNLATYMGAFWALTGVVSIRSALVAGTEPAKHVGESGEQDHGRE